MAAGDHIEVTDVRESIELWKGSNPTAVAPISLIPEHGAMET